jgi:hypothetical protein
MSNPTPTPAPAKPAVPAPPVAPAPDDSQPPETPAPPAEVDWKAEARKHEDRAKAEKKRADANEAAAQRIAEIEESQKTEAQKTAERQAVLERENETLKVAKLRSDVAEAKSDPAKGIVIPASLLTGSTQEEIEASADALIKFRGEHPRSADAPIEGGQPPALPLNGDGLETALKKKLGIAT